MYIEKGGVISPAEVTETHIGTPYVQCVMTEAASKALAYSLALEDAMGSYETLASISLSASRALEVHDKMLLAEEQMAKAEEGAYKLV